MTNKEKYQKAFSTLHSSEINSLEVEIMEKMKKTYVMKKTLAACAAVAVAFGSMTVAYAADLGGIQEKIYAWFHGTETEMTVTDNGNGNYTYTFTDENGEMHEGGAGGIEIDDNGNEIPLSAEEVLQKTSSEVDEDSDGNVWIYLCDKKYNITDLIKEKDSCKVSINNEKKSSYEGKILYFDITKSKYEEDGKEYNSYGYSVSTTAPADQNSYTHLD